MVRWPWLAQAKPDAPIPRRRTSRRPTSPRNSSSRSTAMMAGRGVTCCMPRVSGAARSSLSAERALHVRVRPRLGREVEQLSCQAEDFDFAPKEARRVRPNASLISTAAQYGVELAKYLANISLQSNIVVSGQASIGRKWNCQTPRNISRAVPSSRRPWSGLLRSWDLGRRISNCAK